MLRFICVLWLFCSFSFIYLSGKRLGGCRFSLEIDIPKPTPVILYANESKIVYPNTTGFINLCKYERLRLLCTGTKFRDEYIKGDQLVVSCYGGKMVRLKNRLVNIRKLECRGYPLSTSRLVGKACYRNRSTTFRIDIGFDVTRAIIANKDRGINQSSFVRQYSVCFDNVTKVSLYSVYDNPKLANGYQVNVMRGSFRDDYYPANMTDRCYHWRNEQRTLASILNSTELAAEYVSDDGKKFLSRGHMTPRGDFLYGFEQTATMYYVNVAPQWQQFNGGNWELLERSVRNFLRSKNGSDYKVATGVYGQTTLPDATGRPRYLYLYRDENNASATKRQQMLTVPRYYWKVIYRKTSDTGIGFIGVNNPYLRNVPENYTICRDICHKLDWITFDVNDIKKGYIMCCRMDQLLKYIRISPKDLFNKA